MIERIKMKFLVIKHVVVEGLGIFEKFISQAGIDTDTVELEKGDPFPDLENYQALWVMGGPMNVDDELDYPWLIEEKKLIQKAVENFKIPYIGVCLGAQLLAVALGGEVGPMPTPEVGLLPITLTQLGLDDSLMSGLSETLKVLQWHGQEVKKLPLGSKVLASSDHCHIQAFSAGKFAYGLQFHSEITDITVDDWIEIPEYRTDLESVLGSEGTRDLKQAVSLQLSTMNTHAKLLFDNFLIIIKEQMYKIHEL